MWLKNKRFGKVCSGFSENISLKRCLLTLALKTPDATFVSKYNMLSSLEAVQCSFLLSTLCAAEWQDGRNKLSHKPSTLAAAKRWRGGGGVCRGASSIMLRVGAGESDTAISGGNNVSMCLQRRVNSDDQRRPTLCFKTPVVKNRTVLYFSRGRFELSTNTI